MAKRHFPATSASIYFPAKNAAIPIWLSTISGACPVGYPSLDLFFILSGMMSLAAPAFLPIRLRAPDDEAA